MVFPSLNFERVIQVDDKLRLDASLSFSPDEIITDVEIKPSGADSFISVFNSNTDKWFLDWAYESDGNFTIEVQVTSAASTRVKTYDILVLTKEEDALLSEDNDLYAIEPTLKRYLPNGKNSFQYAHRVAQDTIIAYLDEQRIWKSDSSRYTKQDLVDITDGDFQYQFKQWSKYQTLILIFESLQLGTEDIYEEKKKDYDNQMRQHRNRASLRLDKDGDGVVDEIPYNIRSTRLLRR